MKTTPITICFWLATLAGTLAQGVVNFANLGTLYADGIDRRICESYMVPVIDTTWSAQLLEHGMPVGAPQSFLGTWAPGVWTTANRTLSVPGGVETSLAVQILDDKASP